MKLRKLHIKNFRAIADLELDFTDDFGEARDVILIVGPNASGKTSILDAIWFGLQGQFGYPHLREHFRAESEYVVRHGAHYTSVRFEISISEQELIKINEWKNKLVELESLSSHPDAKKRIGELEWTYPAQHGYKKENDYGGYKYINEYDWEILRARAYYNMMRRSSARHVSGRELVGGVYFFEQERQILSSPVRQIAINNDDDDSNQTDKLNIRSLLINFGLKDKLDSFNRADSWYKKIQSAYNTICAPHTMGEVYTTGSSSEYKIDFHDNEGKAYGFDGLSSGERSVLNFLIQYVYKRMYNSIVLIDELEMHLHPTWQRRLLDGLRNFDDGNQFIIATHSPILEQSVPSDAIISLGKLDNIPDWQKAPLVASEQDG